MRRRDLLRRRYGALLAAIAVTACVLAAVVAHAASVPALPVVVAAACAAVALAGAAVCAQAWEIADRAVHAVGLALRTAGVLAFGSLATGAGRQHLNSALHAPPLAALILLVALALTAVAGCLLGYRGLDRIDVGLLRGGQGLWTAGGVAAMSMDVFMLSDFLADQRARQAGRVRPTRLGAGFAAALARSEWARVRRRPSLALRAAVAAIVWWGCRPVVDRPSLAALALVTGYCLVLPVGDAAAADSEPGIARPVRRPGPVADGRLARRVPGRLGRVDGRGRTGPGRRGRAGGGDRGRARGGGLPDGDPAAA